MKRVVLAAALMLGAHAHAAPAGPPLIDDVRAAWRSSDATLLDRNGELLHVLRLDTGVRKMRWVSLADISPAMIRAIVLSEDRRFREHDGVDWQAIAGAALRRIEHAGAGPLRGASTITMQLAGLLEARLAWQHGGRTLSRKFDQIVEARRIEQSWTKDDILEAYLNLVPFRGDIVGIDALASTMFGKLPGGLDHREAAIAAVLVRSPGARARVVAAQACRVEQQLGAATAAADPKDTTAPDDCFGMAEDVGIALSQAARPATGPALVDREDGHEPMLQRSPQLALHVARRLLKSPGQVVRSTLDAPTQRVAIDAIARHLAALGPQLAEDAAVVVLDNASGAVLAWVGSSGGLSSAAQVDHALAPRQAGSTLKPFLYATALDARLLTAASLLDDSPLAISAGAGLYVPQNYDHAFRGAVSVRTALASSMNIPAVRTLQLVSPDTMFAKLKAAGIDTLHDSGNYYGPSLALGSADVSLAALTNAYRTLANGGRAATWHMTAMRAGTKVFEDGAMQLATKQVFSPQASFIVADILSDRNARVATFGFDSVLATRARTAVKTGTSKDMRDNWCVGFSSRYTVGVWVGNTTGASMRDVSGISGAAPIWADVMNTLQRGGVEPPAAPPPGLVRARVGFSPAVEASRDEWFMAGTEATEMRQAGASTLPPAISNPVAGSIIALDPDIPPTRQRLAFETTSGRALAGKAAWRLDGRPVGDESWMPQPGRHRLELWVDGALADSVGFEVRGANIRRPPPGASDDRAGRRPVSLE